MVYCVSDIHGDELRFDAMLEKIGFSDADTLYVLGDVIDRGPRGVELLRRVKQAHNMVMLMGNHERMCLDTLGRQQVFGARQLWQQNGGSRTYRDLVYRCTPVERAGLIRFIDGLPTFLEVEVEGKKFHLVHGYPGSGPKTRLWGRPDPDFPAPFPDRTVIVGHTPTCFITQNFDDPCAIWHGDGVVCIDCGCGHGSPIGRLAALRLEDMQEFYV